MYHSLRHLRADNASRSFFAMAHFVLPVIALLMTSLLFRTGLAAPRADRRQRQPNILFIFADDLCFQTIHATGCDEVETPNIDRLVRDGLTFSHAYNQGSWTGAVCVASRTMLNTGRFLWRAHRVSKSLDKERLAGRLWAQYLQKAGYETYFSGKWHLRTNAEKTFDFVTHVRPGMPKQTNAGYDRPIEGQPDVWKPWDPSRGGYWQGGKHWSEVLGDDSIVFLQQATQHEKPFFMYLAFNAPHDPRQSPKQYVDRYPTTRIKMPVNFLPEYPFDEAMGCGRKLRDERLAPFPRTPYAVKVHRQEYYAIITHMDAQVGRILEALKQTGKLENTYIFFTADHGLAVGQHGLMGKQNMFDHSVRVPLVVCGPGVTGDEKIDTRVYLQDIMPTTLELAGVPKPAQVQFKSLLPLIRGQEDKHYDATYGAYLGRQRMVTAGQYKLILYPTINKVLLFDLKADPHEMKNLADRPEYQATTKRLFHRLLKLQEETGDELDLKSALPELNRH